MESITPIRLNGQKYKSKGILLIHNFPGFGLALSK